MNPTDPSIQQRQLDKEELIMQLRGGVSLPDAADELDLSVEEALELLSHTPKQLPARRGQRRELDEEAIVEDYRAKVRLFDILTKYNISQATLYTMLHKHQVALRRGTAKPGTPEERQAIVDLYEAGLTLHAIRAATGRSTTFIYGALNAAGVERRLP